MSNTLKFEVILRHTSCLLIIISWPVQREAESQFCPAKSNVTQRGLLQKLVRFAARVVSGRRKYDHVSDVIDDLGWLSVDSMHRYHYLVLLRKMLVTSEPENLAGNLVTRQSVHGRDTRQSDMLLTPVIRSESGRRRYLFTAVSEYNELPPALRNPSYPAFKRGLKEYLREQERAD